LLTAGINMLKTPQVGQNGFDTFAEGAQTGVSTLDQLRQRDLGQKTAADITAFDQSSTTRQLEQGDTQIAQQGEANQIRRGALAENVRQFESKLAEDARQFDERLASPGGFSYSGGGAGSTGPERQEELAYNAFVASGIYPDTPQGQALARLRSQGLIGQDLTNPRDKLAFSSKLATDLKLFHPEMTNEEIVNEASTLTDMLAKRANAGDPSIIAETEAPAIPNYNGTITYRKDLGEGKARQKADGNYEVDFGGRIFVMTPQQLYDWNQQEFVEWDKRNGSARSE